MKRLALAICILVGSTAGPASAATLCVGSGAGCFATLQAAVAAAHDGDTIRVGRGTFAGGVMIDKSISLVGEGSNATIISGGGPVLTIFREPHPEQLTVAIRGVTITGGVNDSEPDHEVTFGGGIWIPTSQLPEPPFNGTGATVSLADSVVTGNTVTSRTAIPPGPFCGPLAVRLQHRRRDRQRRRPDRHRLPHHEQHVGLDAVVRVACERPHRRRDRQPFLLDARLEAERRQREPRRGTPHRTDCSQGRVDSAAPGRSRSRTASSATTAQSCPERRPAARSRSRWRAGSRSASAVGSAHPPATLRNTVVHDNQVTVDAGNADVLSVAFGGGILAEAPLLVERTAITDNLVRAVSAGDAAADGGGIEVDSAVTIRDSLDRA